MSTQTETQPVAEQLITLAPMTVAEARMLSNAWAVFVAAATGEKGQAVLLLQLGIAEVEVKNWLLKAEAFTGGKMQPVLDAVITASIGPEKAKALNEQVEAEMLAEAGFDADVDIDGF